ncbi:hypothetical protein ACSW8S_17480 (plasmid) [Clostridium perfringens]|nr:hypothetical protein [Clostridium perfringens]MDM0976823.1 hypothetical protein [Clostridium perfringens]
MIRGNAEKEKIIKEINKCIDFSNNSSLNLAKEYIKKELRELQLKFNETKKKKIGILKDIVYLMTEYSVKDVSWSMYCQILYKLLKNSSSVSRYMIECLSSIFIFIIDNVEYSTREIDELRYYRKFLECDVSWKIKSITMGDNEKEKLYGYFWFNSKLKNLYIHDERKNLIKKRSAYEVIINLNENNELIKGVLCEFIENISGNNTLNKVRDTVYQQFIYYFTNSLSELDDEIRHIGDFNFNVFKKQYKFYKKLSDRRKIKKSRPVLQDILKEFYIFLVNYMIDKGIECNIFNGTNISINELINSRFLSYYSNGYQFVIKDGFADMPRNNRWAIRADANASTSTHKLEIFDFTKVANKYYREDLKNYVWYQTEIGLSTLYKYVHDITYFLNYKEKFVLEYKDSLFADKVNEFPIELFASFKTYTLMKVNNANTRVGIFSSVRKYLSYYRKKYNITDLHLKYISTALKERENTINPVDINDFEKLAQEFINNKELSTIDELYYIIFNLKSTTKLRIGEILNLERDCINIFSDDGETCSISLRTKGRGEHKREILLSRDKVDLLRKAIELTEHLLENTISEDKKYIFIKESNNIVKNKNSFIHVVRISGLSFSKKFNQIQEKVLGEVKYIPYNLRQMFKNIIHNEGAKENISILVLENLTGSKYRTDIRHYVKNNNINLYAEIFAGVVISDVDLNGEVIDDDEIERLNIVEDGVGACRTIGCSIDEMYKCIKCSNFVTSISRKEKFKEKIEKNKELLLDNISEDIRNYLIAENKLYAAYYAKIIELEQK